MYKQVWYLHWRFHSLKVQLCTLFTENTTVLYSECLPFFFPFFQPALQCKHKRIYKFTMQRNSSNISWLLLLLYTWSNSLIWSHNGLKTEWKESILGWIRPHTISHRLLASKILHSPTTWPEAGYVIRLCIRNAIIVATAFIILVLDFCIISTQLPHNFLLAFVSLCTRCTVLWLSCHALDHHCSHLCITVGLWEAFVGYGCTEVVPPPHPQQTEIWPLPFPQSKDTVNSILLWC